MNPKPSPTASQPDNGYVLVTIEEEAKQILQAARAEAEKVLAKAKSVSPSPQGVEDIEQLQQLSRTLGTLIEQLKHNWKQFTHSAETELLELAFAIAKLVVGREITTSDGALATAIRRAAKQVVPGLHWQVLVNPRDLTAARKLLPDLCTKLVSEGWLVLVPSELISPGGCLVKSQHIEVDATIETQLAQIRRLLFSASAADTSPVEEDQLSKSSDEVTAGVYYPN